MLINEKKQISQLEKQLKQVSKIKIPYVDVVLQRAIVSKIEKEQQLVNSNKQIIEIFEQKIKDRIAKVWGE